MNVSKDFLEFIGLLNEQEVAYLVVGGYAVGFHGYPRYTGDLDIWIHREEKNADRLFLALKKFGGPVSEINKSDLLKKPTKKNRSPGISFGREPLRIEIINSIDGVKFENCIEQALIKKIGGINVKYINYNDLKKNKTASGRPQDLSDLVMLAKRIKLFNKKPKS